MSKHTPGPWITDDDTEVIAKIPSDSPNKSSPDILTICRAVDVEIYADNRSGSTAANARLIAAAPDLLDVAKRLDDAVGFFLAALPTNHAVAKDLIGLRDVARASIAKAEGGAA